MHDVDIPRGRYFLILEERWVGHAILALLALAPFLVSFGATSLPEFPSFSGSVSVENRAIRRARGLYSNYVTAARPFRTQWCDSEAHFTHFLHEIHRP